MGPSVIFDSECEIILQEIPLLADLKAYNLTIVSRDRFSNQLSVSKSRFEVTLIDGQELRRRVIALNDGLYFLEVQTIISGLRTIKITQDGIDVKGSPSDLVFFPNIAVPPLSSILGPFISLSTAGYLSLFTIQMKDAYLNFRSFVDEIITIGVQSGQQAASELTDVQPLDGGRFLVQYALTYAGLYRMNVLANTISIGPNPYFLRVNPAESKALNSFLFGPGRFGGILSTNITFGISTVDAFGNARDQIINTDTVSVIVVAVGGYGYNFSTNYSIDVVPLPPCPAPLPQCANYLAQYLTTVSGVYSISAFVNNELVAGEKIEAIIIAGVLSAQNSFVYESSIMEGVAGVNNTFQIQSVDLYLNHETKGGSMYYVALFPFSISPKIFNVSALNPKNITIFAMYANDLRSGRYQGLYMHTVSGSYYLQITLASIDIKGSPFNITIYPNKIVANNSIAYGNVVSLVTAGYSTYIILLAKDVYGNLVDSSHNQVMLEFTNQNSMHEDVLVNIMPQYGGIYNITYLATVAGFFNVYVYSNDTEIFYGFPVSIYVNPGLLYPGECTFEGLIPATTNFQEFLVVTRDFYSNPLTNGGNYLQLTLNNRVIDVESVVIDFFIEYIDLLNGLYRVTYTATISDYYVLSVQANDKHVKDSPFTFFVDPGTSNGPQSVAFGDGLRNGIRVDTPPMLFEISTADAYGNFRTSG